MNALTLIGPGLLNNGTILSSRVLTPNGAGDLWFRVDPRRRGLLGFSVDPFVTASVPIAMKMGWNIEVCTPMSARLYEALSGPVQEAIARVRPELKPVKIQPNGLYSSSLREGAGMRATGFSGGVDSWWVIGQHLSGSNKLDLLTFHDVGSHGAGSKGRAFFEKRLARAQATAEVIGLPLVAVRSNLRDWIWDMKLKFEHVPALCNLAAAQATQGGVGEFLYAASFLETETVREYTNSSLADPLIVPRLGTESLTTSLVGAHLTRIERTAAVTEIRESHDRLDVCFDSPDYVVNCGKCPKCVRTAMTLNLLGKLDLYRGVFDLQAYTGAVPRFVRNLLKNQSHSVLDREVLSYAEEHGIGPVNTYLGPQEAQ